MAIFRAVMNLGDRPKCYVFNFGIFLKIVVKSSENTTLKRTAYQSSRLCVLLAVLEEACRLLLDF